MGSGKCILFNYVTYNAYIKYPSLLCVSLLRHWIVHTASAKHCYIWSIVFGLQDRQTFRRIVCGAASRKVMAAMST